MRALALAALLAGGVAAAHQPAPAAAPKPWTHPFLWRIDGPRPSYLVGTMHLPDPRVAHFPPALEHALETTDGVMLELPLDLGTQLVAGLRMIGPPGEQLRDLAPAPLQERMKKLVAASGGSWGMMERLRPVAATMMLGLQEAARGGVVIDQALWDWARDHNKEHAGIETIDEQLSLLEGSSRADQLTLLEEAVAQAEKRDAADAFEPLRAAYFGGDEKRALELLRADKGSPAAERLEHRMIDVRNARMAERIAARLHAGAAPTVYAFGLAHMLGKNGIVARLGRAGFKVSRVR